MFQPLNNTGYFRSKAPARALAYEPSRPDPRDNGETVTAASAQGMRVLLVEDDYFLAQELARELAERGAEIVGFATTLEKALALNEKELTFNAAILDIKLRDDYIFPAVSLMREREVAVVFITGFDTSIIPEEFRDIPCLSKPADPEILVRALGGGG